jgi:hypothetical protein
MRAAGQTYGGNPGGALVDYCDDDEKMEKSGSSGVLRRAVLGCDWFADGVYARFPLKLAP